MKENKDLSHQFVSIKKKKAWTTISEGKIALSSTCHKTGTDIFLG